MFPGVYMKTKKEGRYLMPVMKKSAREGGRIGDGKAAAESAAISGVL